MAFGCHSFRGVPWSRVTGRVSPLATDTHAISSIGPSSMTTSTRLLSGDQARGATYD